MDIFTELVMVNRSILDRVEAFAGKTVLAELCQEGDTGMIRMDFPREYGILLSKRRISSFDIGILCTMIMVSLAWMWGFAGSFTSGPPQLRVYQGDGLLYYKTLRTQPKASEIISIAVPRRDHGSYTLKLKVSKEGIGILPLERDVCPDGICWRSGTIRRGGEALFCIPNRISVSLSGRSGEDHGGGETDAVTR